MSVAFLFPGQGAQKVGMGQAVYEASQAGRDVYDAADEILGWSLSSLCFEGSEVELTDTANQQPALFVTGVAMWRGLLADARADFVAGHSLGEFAALVAAGSLSFEAGLRLVALRGRLMKEAGEETHMGQMAAVLGGDTAVVADVCQQASEATAELVQIANDNCPGQVVISGSKGAVSEATKRLQAHGVKKIVLLPISVAAHSPLMAGASEAFATAVDATAITDPQIPIVGNTTAGLLTDSAAVRVELKAQLTSAVRWTESMRFLVAQEVSEIIEVGPGKTLQSLMKRIDRKVARRSARD